MITEMLSDSGRFAREMATAKFKHADRLKVNKKEYSEYTHASHLAGKTAICEAIIKAHSETPYNSIDELIGDLQLMLVQSGNQFRELNFKRGYDKLSLERVM